MAYDEALADRTRDAIGMRKGVTEKRMFGGVANDDLMVRVARPTMTRRWQSRTFARWISRAVR